MIKGNIFSLPLVISAIVILVTAGIYFSLFFPQKNSISPPSTPSDPSQPSKPTEYQPVEISELIANMDKYNNQKVSVKGTYDVNRLLTTIPTCVPIKAKGEPEILDSYQPSGSWLLRDEDKTLGVVVINENNTQISNEPNYSIGQEIEFKGIAKTTTVPSQCNENIHYKSIYLEVKTQDIDIDIKPQSTTKPNDVSAKIIDFKAIKVYESFTDPMNKVIQTDTEWSSLFTNINKTVIGDNILIPVVDFAKYSIIGVIAGTKSTGGYSIKIDSIEERPNEILVKFTETSPGNNCLTTQAFTYPSNFVQILKITKEVDFQKSSVSKDCGN